MMHGDEQRERLTWQPRRGSDLAHEDRTLEKALDPTRVRCNFYSLLLTP